MAAKFRLFFLSLCYHLMDIWSFVLQIYSAIKCSFYMQHERLCLVLLHLEAQLAFLRHPLFISMYIAAASLKQLCQNKDTQYVFRKVETVHLKLKKGSVKWPSVSKLYSTLKLPHVLGSGRSNMVASKDVLVCVFSRFDLWAPVE